MRAYLLVLTSFFVIFLQEITYADRVEFSNGDILTGTIVEINENYLVINTDIAGVLTIKRKDIKKIESTSLVEVTYSSGETFQGTLHVSGDKYIVQEGKEKKTILWEEVKKIAPLSTNEDAEGDPLIQKDKRKWSGNIRASATLQKGTTDTITMESGIAISGRKRKDSINIELDGAYGEVEQQINTRRYGGKFRYQYYPKEKWYIYTDTNAERDESRKLGLRGQIGGGTGYEIISQPRQTWALEGALMLTHEEWLPYVPYEKDKVKEQNFQDGLNKITQASQRLIQSPEDITSLGDIIGGTINMLNPLGNNEKTKQDYTSLKLGSNYTRKIFNSELSHSLTFEPNLEHIDNYRLCSLTTLVTPVSKNLSIDLTLSNDYDSEHQERRIEPWEHRLSAGIRYDFGKKD